MPSNFGSNLGEKFRNFMSRRNGPDTLSRDMLILAVVLIILSFTIGQSVGTVLITLALVALAYSYFRLFSSNVSARLRENEAYSAKRHQILSKISGPFKRMGNAGAKAAKQAQRQAQDREHRYFNCPKCGQSVRVPKGAGKIRVTCPKCGEQFEKKA